MTRGTFALAAAAATGVFAAGFAGAVEVNFDGVVENICTISDATDGALAASPNGTTLTSDIAGGSSGSVSVISTGSNTLTFGAPSLAATPAGYAGSPTLTIAFAGAGVTQGATSGATTHAIDYPGGDIVIDAEAVDTAGFMAGDYTVQTIVTCAPTS